MHHYQCPSVLLTERCASIDSLACFASSWAERFQRNSTFGWPAGPVWLELKSQYPIPDGGTVCHSGLSKGFRLIYIDHLWFEGHAQQWTITKCAVCEFSNGWIYRVVCVIPEDIKQSSAFINSWKITWVGDSYLHATLVHCHVNAGIKTLVVEKDPISWSSKILGTSTHFWLDPFHMIE